MPKTIDTGVIELYLCKHLKQKDARQFEMRLLRDAAFLEKVFMQKAKLSDMQSDNAPPIVQPLQSNKIRKTTKKHNTK
jgi:anti-sigma-K factor RskA